MPNAGYPISDVINHEWSRQRHQGVGCDKACDLVYIDSHGGKRETRRIKHWNSREVEEQAELKSRRGSCMKRDQKYGRAV